MAYLLRSLLVFVLVFSLGAPLVQAEDDAPSRAVPLRLSKRDQADVERLEQCLNNLKSFTAGFTQVNDQGQLRHGTLALQRPGKMRVTYDPPSEDFIVADGNNLHVWDSEMKQQSVVSLDSSLAAFILRSSIKLSGDVTLTALSRAPAKIEVSLVSTNDPAEGQLTLVFEDKPLQLRQWRVFDAQGRMTGVSLENVREDTTFPDETFHFIAPNFGKSPKKNGR